MPDLIEARPSYAQGLTVTAAQIATPPGIGPKTADLIVQYRTKNGGFKEIAEQSNGMVYRDAVTLRGARATIATAAASLALHS